MKQPSSNMEALLDVEWSLLAETGVQHQLLVDRADARTPRTNLCRAWIDYKTAYDDLNRTLLTYLKKHLQEAGALEAAMERTASVMMAHTGTVTMAALEKLVLDR